MFAPTDRVYLYGTLGYSQNYAHVLLDNVLPAYAASQIFGFNVSSAQLVGRASCDNFYMADGAANTGFCNKNLERWMAPFFDHPFMAPPHADMCFGQLITGHEASLGLNGLYLHRSTAIRAMRHRLLSANGIPTSHRFPLQHAIVVINKVVLTAPVEVPDLRKTVLSLVSSFFPPPPVTCLTFPSMSVQDQLLAVRNASLVIAEHGSTTYSSMFHEEGSSFIAVLLPGVEAKEVQVLLYNTDVQMWFVTMGQL